MYKDKKIIIYDDFCVVCSLLSKIVCKLDKKDKFRLTSVNSKIRKDTLNRNPELKNIDSIILLESYKQENEKISIKSDAIIKIIINLHPLLKIFRIYYLVPSFLRDLFYDVFAKFRKKIFGDKNECDIPDSKFKHKFI